MNRLFILIIFLSSSYLSQAGSVLFSSDLFNKLAISDPTIGSHGSGRSDSLKNLQITVAPTVKYGIKLGVNRSNMNFNRGYPTPATLVETSWRNGFVAGFILQVGINKKFSIHQEYLYSTLAGQINSLSISYKLKYISLPLLFSYTLSPRIKLKAGPQFDLLLSSVENDMGTNTNIIHETEARNIAIDASIEVQLFKKISLDLRYMNGINHIAIKQQTMSKEFKYDAFQVSIKFTL